MKVARQEAFKAADAQFVQRFEAAMKTEPSEGVAQSINGKPAEKATEAPGDGEASENASEASETQETPKEAKGDPSGKPKVPTLSPEERKTREASLKELAASLGFEFDGARIAVSERHEFRETKRKAQERLQQSEQELMSRISKVRDQARDDIARAQSIVRAVDSDDPNALAKALGKRDWNDLSAEVIARMADPNYKRLTELENEVQERKRSEEEHAQRQRQQAENQKRAAAERNWLTDISRRCKESKDPLLAALHDDPRLARSIYAVQRHHGDSSIRPETALNLKLPGSDISVRDAIRTEFDRLNRAFGKSSPAPAPAAKTPEKKPKTQGISRSAVVPPSRGAVDPSPRRPFGSRREHDEKFRAALAEAAEADRKASQER